MAAKVVGSFGIGMAVLRGHRLYCRSHARKCLNIDVGKSVGSYPLESLVFTV